MLNWLARLAGLILVLAALLSSARVAGAIGEQREAKLVSSSSGWILDNAQLAEKPPATQQPVALDEEQPIVLNSVHSGQPQQQQQQYHSALPALSARRPPTGGNWIGAGSHKQQHRTSSFALKREPPLTNKQHNNFSSNYQELQEARSGAQPHRLVGVAQSAHSQQPSQEFDSQTIAPRARPPLNRWSSQARPSEASGAQQQQYVQNIQRPLRDYHGISAAPYAVTSSQHQPQQANQALLAQQQLAAAEQFEENHQSQQLNMSSLIRDTSELNKANTWASEQREWAPQPAQPSLEGPTGSMWAQSVRDNHHGPLRSRFNLTALGARSGGPGALSAEPADMVVPVGGNAHLFDGHMRAKAGPNTVPYEQQVQAKSVRTSNPLAAAEQTAAADGSFSSRRNSKFTRQSAESTTPLSPVGSRLSSDQTDQAPFRVTSNRHAPAPMSTGAGRRQPTANATTAPTEAPASGEPDRSGAPNQTSDPEPATGSGHVIPLNETDLVRLGQKFELGYSNKSLGQTGNEIGEQQQASLERRAGEQQAEEIIQVMGNHHNGHLQKINTINGTLEDQRSRIGANADLQAKTNKPMEPNNPTTTGEILVMSNNHSIRGQVQAASQANTLNSTYRSAYGRPPLKQSGGIKTARKLSWNDHDDQQPVAAEARSGQQQLAASSGSTSGGGNQARAWTRLLPVLLQRTISGFLRRLTGATSTQHQQPGGLLASPSVQHQQHVDQHGNLFGAPSGQPMVKFDGQQVGSAGGSFGFIASALSAAASSAAAIRPDRNTPGAFEHSQLDGKQLQQAGSIHEPGRTGQQHPPRQHANKKIIDSFEDLPVSERRQMLDRREGDSLESPDGAAESPDGVQADAHQFTELMSRSVDDRAAGASDSTTNKTVPVDHSQRMKSRRNSKTTSDWKEYDSRKQSEPKLRVKSSPPAAPAVDDYEADQAGADDHDGAAESSDVEETSDSLVASDGRQLLENQSPNRDEDYVESPVGQPELRANDDYEPLDSADSFVVENTKLYNMASRELGGHHHRHDDWRQPMSAKLVSGDRGLHEEEADDEEVSYAAHSLAREAGQDDDLDTKPSFRVLNTRAGIVSAGSGALQRPSPVESAADDEQEAPVEPRLVPKPAIRHRKPIGLVPVQRLSKPVGNQKRRRPAGEALSPPPISLEAAKLAGRAPVRQASSQALKPISVFTGPTTAAESQDGQQGSNMMSPMSSSINVMDLDPSMTRLAHNKLIVAKFKPRNKLKVAMGHRTSKPLLMAQPRDSVGDSIAKVAAPKRPQPPSPSEQNSASVNQSKPARSKPTQTEPTVASLTSAILGTQVITNNHINDIIKRWSKPQQQPATSRSSASGSKPVSLQAESNATRWLTDSANLRIVNDLHSFVPLASGLAARFSFPGARTALSTSTTSTTARPRPSADHHVSVAGQQQADSSSAQSSGSFKNDKFNFSLIQMNNRERVNPLLFPVDHPLRQSAINHNQTQAKRNQTRSRISSSTTTFRPQTRPTSPSSTAASSSSTTTTPRPGESATASRLDSTTTPSTGSSSPVEGQSSSTMKANVPYRARWPSSSRRPAATLSTSHKQQSVEGPADAELALGQILRSQHNNLLKPASKPLTDADRLRNQYHALIGKNSSLDGRDSVNMTTLTALPAEASLSGHISVAASSDLLSGEPVSAASSSDNRFGMPHASVEEAAHDANKYLTVSAGNSPADQADNDHSIVILNDNHHQQTRRTPSPHRVGGSSSRRPLLGASMLYSSQKPALEQYTTLPPALTDEYPMTDSSPTLSSSQAARKYLEEFVNGSRIRPSSVASIRTTTNTPKSGHEPKDKSTSTAAEHPGTPTGSTESPMSGLIRRFHTDRLLPSGSKNFTAFNSVNGAPFPDSSGLMGVEKLDAKAQELLLDVFDRDPSYSMNGIFANQAGSNNNEQLHFLSQQANKTRDNIEEAADSGGDDDGSLRKVYISNNQRTGGSQPGNRLSSGSLSANGSTSVAAEQPDGGGYTVTESVPSPTQSSTTVFVELGEEKPVNGSQQLELNLKANQASEQQSGHEVALVAGEETELRSTESGLAELTTTTSSGLLGGSQGDAATTMSSYDEMNARGEHNHLEQSMQHLSAESGNHRDDTNNRASMRKNQAKIQAILMAIAKKNRNAASSTTTTEEPDLDSTDQEMAASQQYPTTTYGPPLGGSSAGDSAESSPSEMSSGSEFNELHETTQFYAAAPMKSTTLPASFQAANNAEPQRRYPNVETLSSSRQKINRPASNVQSGALFGGQQEHGQPLGASTPPMPTAVTTKLTESPTNDVNLKQAIKNRVGPEMVHKQTRRPILPSSTDPPSGELDSSTDGSSLSADGGSLDDEDNQQLDNRRRRPTDSDRVTTEASEFSPAEADAQDQADRYQNGNEEPPQRLRPVIIRRRPRPSSTRRPAGELPHRITLEVHSDHHKRPNQSNKKRRRRPTKQPSTTQQEGEQLVTLSPTYVEEPANASVLTDGEVSSQPVTIQLGDGKHRVRPHSILLRPSSAGAQSIIKKRPGYPRLPPDSIRIQDSLYGLHQNKTIMRRPAGQHNSTQPVSIILPMESLIKRKHQDIRTRPLIIIDPITEPPLDASNESVVNPGTWTRIPETTIMHNKMVVTYKPGRPLPGATSGFGSIGQVSPGHTRPYLENGSSGSGSSTSAGSTTTSTLEDGPSFGGSSANSSSGGEGVGTTMSVSLTRPQLGSGNGGDTHLVSIEQQQQSAALQSTRRPYLGVEQSSSANSELAASTTSMPPYQPPAMAISHRPIIVINGLFGNSNDQQHTSSSHKPNRPNGSTLVEAGSMSVVAQASHGQSQSSHNSSRPWYPTSQSSGRPHTNSSSSGNTTVYDIIGAESSSSSNQTADSVVDSELPNFGGGGATSPPGSISGPSGSFNNHNFQQHQQTHFGTPHTGPGTTLTSRPSVGGRPRPYPWRVIAWRKPSTRPNGTSSGAYFDHNTSASSTSLLYRPPLLSYHTLINIWDNLMLFVHRVQTFLIHMAVMFLPPLALAASIVSVMSS